MTLSVVIEDVQIILMLIVTSNNVMFLFLLSSTVCCCTVGSETFVCCHYRPHRKLMRVEGPEWLSNGWKKIVFEV